MNIKHKLLCAFLAGVLVLTGCTGTEHPHNTASETNNEKTAEKEENLNPYPGGTLRLACFAPDTLNPLATQYQNVRDVLMIIYEGLFKSESTLNAVPVLAEGYTVSTSNKIYTIKLKRDVVFHDGSAFDAADVIATFNYIKAYPTPYTEIFSNVLSFKAEDSYTVTVELISPQIDFVNNLDFPILPSGLSKEAFVSENSAFVPIGTGKFKYDGQVRNKYMTCSRNENIYDGKQTYIDSVKVSFMHSAEEIFLAFDAGETDMFTTNGSNWGEFTFTSAVKSFETGSPRYTYMGINIKNAYLSDAALRRDINAVINKKELVEEVMFSHAVPAELPIISTAYYNNLEENSENKEKNDGQLQTDEISQKTPDFNKYNISVYLLYNNESKEKQRAAQYIKKALEPYGITVVLQSTDFEEYKKRIAEENYDLYIGETVMNNNMNMDFMFTSALKSAQNLCNFSSDEFDNLLNNINMMSPGNENSKIAYSNFKKYFFDNVPQIPLFHTNTALFVSNRIKGSVTPNMSFFYGDAEDFFIYYN